MSKEKEIECSFCNNTLKDVKKMISGKGDAFICDQCIELCIEIVRVPFYYPTNMLPTKAEPANN